MLAVTSKFMDQTKLICISDMAVSSHNFRPCNAFFLSSFGFFGDVGYYIYVDWEHLGL